MNEHADHPHQHLTAAVDHLRTVDHAQVLVVCGGPEHARSVFVDLADLAVATLGLKVYAGYRGIQSATGHLRVLAGGDHADLIGVAPTLIVDHYATARASDASYERLNDALHYLALKRGAQLLRA